MRKIVLAVLLGLILFCLAYGLGICSPFLVCDPQAGVTSYKLTGPSWVPVTVAAQPDGSIKMDVATATVGSNVLTVAACKTDPIWGELCSSAVNFTFTRPASPSGSVNIGLIK